MSEIKLPVDATGKEIPLDTEVLYDEDGLKNTVKCFSYYPGSYPADTLWVVGFSEGGSALPKDCTIDPPDSWEKLLEDMGRAIGRRFSAPCCYFNCVEPDRCDDCPANSSGACSAEMLTDIACRIRALRGESDES